MVATTQRHPLVDLFISAGLAVDAAQNLRSGDPRSFAYQIAQPLTLGEIDVPDVETHVQMWAKSAQSASNPASGPVVTQLVAHVLACYDAATTLPESDDPAELYRVYLDVFIEYMTPTNGSGGRCCKYIGPMPAKHLLAQALGVADANNGKVPRSQLEFCNVSTTTPDGLSMAFTRAVETVITRFMEKKAQTA